MVDVQFIWFDNIMMLVYKIYYNYLHLKSGVFCPLEYFNVQ